jgi:hypothetical protein
MCHRFCNAEFDVQFRGVQRSAGARDGPHRSGRISRRVGIVRRQSGHAKQNPGKSVRTNGDTVRVARLCHRELLDARTDLRRHIWRLGQPPKQRAIAWSSTRWLARVGIAMDLPQRGLRRGREGAPPVAVASGPGIRHSPRSIGHQNQRAPVIRQILRPRRQPPFVRVAVFGEFRTACRGSGRRPRFHPCRPALADRRKSRMPSTISS